MPTTSDKPQTLAEQIRVKKIECVSIESGFEERADPIWRIELNGYCADFEYQTAAENFAEQIRAALADAAMPAEHAGDVGQTMPEWGTSDKMQHYAAMVADTNDADILRAAISDLCHDNERLAVMLKSVKQPDPTPPTALSGPPKDGRMLCLLVDYSDGDHPLEDAKQAWTIGYNTLADTGDDEWLIAGWSWEQDCYTDGRGTVIGWLPFPCDPTPALGWKAMQTFACEVISAYDEHDQQLCCDGRECGCQGATVHQAMRHYIKADPGPTDAQLLAEALKLPEVQAMRTALQTLRNLMCEGFEDDDGNSGCGQCENDCTGCIAHFALVKIGGAA